MSQVVHGGDSIHIAVCCDRDYAMPVTAMLASLVALADPRRSLVIHVLGYDLPSTAWSHLTGSVPGNRVQWHRIDVNASGLFARGFGTRPHEHISPVTYLRLLLPEVLPPALEKVLYLDSDMIVCDDIARLWDTDIAIVDFAAAPERDPAASRASSRRGILHYRDLGMDPDLAIFNAGVLLINLRRWRDSHVASRAFGYLRCLGHEVRWYEQDALNVVANGRYGRLDPRWNVPSRAAKPGSGAPTSIVHYLTAHKPWHWDYAWPQRDLFFTVLDRTAYAGWRPLRPHFGAPKRWLAMVQKAARKRLHALHGAWRSLRRDLSYRLIVPPSLGGGHPGLGRRGAVTEIRLFLSVPRFDPQLEDILNAYATAGVDRAVVLNHSGTEPVGPHAPASRLPLHHFARGGAAEAIAFRRLLDRYGTGHWCVLGDPSGIIVDTAGLPVALREYCARLDREAVEVAEAVIGPGGPIELIARDLRTGRVFRSSALAVCPPRAYDPPVFGSRVVLIKYRRNLMLDAGAVLVGNASRSTRLLRISPLNPPIAS